jgi:hypothetical protein
MFATVRAYLTGASSEAPPPENASPATNVKTMGIASSQKSADRSEQSTRTFSAAIE